jgi:hypothetical protein
MLALLESEVARRGGTYAFCDADSLAVNCGARCPKGIPSLPASAIAEVVARFDALNPYGPEIVPHLLKVEYREYPDLRCCADGARSSKGRLCRFQLRRHASGEVAEEGRSSGEWGP